MSRTYIFRAKSLSEPSQWVFGSLLQHADGSASIVSQSDGSAVFVDPDTIGQATGIDDIDGRPIFEGDIVVGIRPVDRIQISAAVVWNSLEAGFGSSYRLDHSDIYPMVICPRIVGDIYAGHQLLDANPPMPFPGDDHTSPDDLFPYDLPTSL